MSALLTNVECFSQPYVEQHSFVYDMAYRRAKLPRISPVIRAPSTITDGLMWLPDSIMMCASAWGLPELCTPLVAALDYLHNDPATRVRLHGNRALEVHVATHPGDMLSSRVKTGFNGQLLRFVSA